MTAMSSLHMGKQLTPTERDILAKYMYNMTDIMLKDDTVFNRTKLHTQRTKYQTEETTVDLDEKMVDGVEIVDGPEEENKKMKMKKEKDVKESREGDEEERMRKKEENKARRLSIRKRDKFRMLPSELKKEKMKAGLEEDIAKINEDYKTMFEAALECYGIDNIRDLPEESKAEFFKVVDTALEEAKMANKDHDGDGKVETSTAEYMGSRDKAIKKSVKLKGFGSSKSNMSNPVARASLMKKEEVEQVNEYITSKQVKMAKGIANDPRHKGGDYSGAAEKMEKIKKGLSNHPAAKKALQQANEEVEQVDELKRSTLSSYIQKAADPVSKKSNANLASKAAYKLAKGDDDSNAGEKEDKKAFVRSKGIQTAAKKLAKEEVELTFEEMTPQQKADRLRLIAKKADYVQSGAAAKASEKRAKADMKQKGAQKGMAPTKKDVVYDKDDKRGSVVEDIQQIRKIIKEGSAKEKIEAYKELNQIIEQYKTTGEL